MKRSWLKYGDAGILEFENLKMMELQVEYGPEKESIEHRSRINETLFPAHL